jgi:hypothetical protein
MLTRYYGLPWIIIFIIFLLVIAFIAWLGYDNWHELP